MKFLKKYSFLIGLVIFPLIIAKLDFLKLVDILSKIDYLYLILALLLSFPLLIIKGYRWNYLKKKQKIYYKLKESILMYGVGSYLGIITPGRLGDLSKIIYLKKDHYSSGKSSVSVILDRLFDLFFLLIVGYLGMFFFASFFQKTIFSLTLIILSIILLLIIISKSNLLRLFFKKIFLLIIPLNYQKSWKLNFQDFINDLKIYQLKDYSFILFITLFYWFIYYSQIFFLARSLNIVTIPFLYLIISVTMAGLITLLPISISGIGTREATLILLFSFFQISPEATISFSMLILSMSILMALIGLVCWFKKPLKFSN